jgi:hypothetical protein
VIVTETPLPQSASPIVLNEMVAGGTHENIGIPGASEVPVITSPKFAGDGHVSGHRPFSKLPVTVGI